MAIELTSLSTRRGFKQAIRIGAHGHIENLKIQEKVSPSEVVTLRDASARVGATLGLGKLTEIAADSPAGALFVVTDANETLAAAFDPAGDTLDDRARDFRNALDPDAGSPVVRRMGFTELRR